MPAVVLLVVLRGVGCCAARRRGSAGATARADDHRRRRDDVGRGAGGLGDDAAGRPALPARRQRHVHRVVSDGRRRDVHVLQRRRLLLRREPRAAAVRLPGAAADLRATGLILRLGSPGDGSPELLGPYYKKLPGPSTPPPYAASHRYELSFTAGNGGRLLMAVARDPNSTYAGTLGVELWGQPVAGDGSTGPSGNTSPDLQDLLNNPEGCAVPLATPIGARAASGSSSCRARHRRGHLPAAPARPHVEPPGPDRRSSSPATRRSCRRRSCRRRSARRP